jgi:putative membrane protein
MKVQWSLIFGILFALIIALFAVINVNNVQVNYLFGEANWPLVLVILGSVFMGGFIIGSVGLVRVYSLRRELTKMEKKNNELQLEIKKYRSNRISDATGSREEFKKSAPDDVTPTTFEQ